MRGHEYRIARMLRQLRQGNQPGWAVDWPTPGGPSAAGTSASYLAGACTTASSMVVLLVQTNGVLRKNTSKQQMEG